jgi:hypothetical protein
MLTAFSFMAAILGLMHKTIYLRFTVLMACSAMTLLQPGFNYTLVEKCIKDAAKKLTKLVCSCMYFRPKAYSIV